MRRTTMAMAAAALVLIGSAAASPGERAAKPADDLIAGRQAAFRMSGALFGGLRGAAERGGDPKSQAFAARSLAGWARAIPGVFPAGSNGGKSAALPTVWSDRAGFEARAADYAAAADKLAAFAAAGDAEGFKTQLREVGASCGACHDKYRKPEEHRPG